jgi:hypothetical protein
MCLDPLPHREEERMAPGRSHDVDWVVEGETRCEDTCRSARPSGGEDIGKVGHLLDLGVGVYHLDLVGLAEGEGELAGG